MRGFPIRSTAFLISTLLLFNLAGCESGSDDSDSTPSTSSSTSSSSSASTSSSGFVPADVQVHFPPVSSTTTAADLTVRGSIQPDADVAAVFVNGEAVASDAEAGTWQYAAELAAGANTLTVTYETGAGDTLTAAELDVTREYKFISPRQFALDESGNRLLVLDAAQRGLLAVDATSGSRALLSPPAGSANLIDNPVALAYAPGAAQLLVYQITDEPFVVIGATDGSQAIAANQPLAGIELTDEVVALTHDTGSEYVISGIERVLINEEGERVTDEEEGRAFARTLLYRYNSVTGVKAPLTQFDQPNTELALGAVTDLATNPDSPYIYVLDRVLSATGADVPRVIRVAKADGSRAMILPGRTEDEEPIEGAYNLRSPSHISLDVDGQSIFVLDAAELIEVDLETFAGVEVSGAEVPEDGAYNLASTVDMTLNSSAGRVYTLVNSPKRVMQVDTATGARSILSANIAADQLTFNSPVSLSLNKTLNEIYVADRGRLRVFDIDLESGTKSVLLETTDADDDGQSDNLLGYPLAVESDQGQRVFTLDDLNTLYRGTPLTRSNFPRLYTIDVESRETTGVVGFNSTLIQLKDLSYVPGDEYVYVLASFPSSTPARTLEYIYRVDLNTSPASTRIFSSTSVPDTRFQFNSVRAIAWDESGKRLLALDSGLNALLAVDGETGARSIISGVGNPADSEIDFELPIALALDAARNRAWVVDSAREELISVDLASGERTLAFASEFFAEARDAQLFGELGVIFVSSVLSNRIDAFDLATGESVTVSY